MGIEVGLDALVRRGGFTWRSWMSPAYVVESILPLGSRWVELIMKKKSIPKATSNLTAIENFH